MVTVKNKYQTGRQKQDNENAYAEADLQADLRSI